ncbi:MAG: type I restriction enzyme HsdR N-terminal domain-containing protein [Rhodospirillaceae bacterium]|nr:type I restriction enzyme HsdR N-terminal domain-containing protein [Rhodospirillaceae bacterium]
MNGDSRLEENLEAFSTRARRIAPACDNEEQTKVSLINPYLEILGYGVRDPLVCRLEYRAGIGQGREKVDYAIMRDGQPSILIEAKPATADFSSPLPVPAQLQRYFMAEKAEFAVLTNGVMWQWYRGGPDGMLLETPFLLHDVRSPGSPELRWLQSVSEPQFDLRNARAQAEDTSIASEILAWIEENRQRPSDDLLRFILRSRKLGSASARRLDRVRESFVATFEAYIDRETDRLLSAARDQQREDPRPTSDEPGTVSKKEDDPPVVDLGDGGTPIRRDAHERAWRVKDGTWRRERSGRELMLSVIRHLDSIDVRGCQRFYDEAVDQWGEPLFLEREGRRWRRVEPEFDKAVSVNRSHRSIEGFLAQACAPCRTSTRMPIWLGEDIELVLDLSSI